VCVCVVLCAPVLSSSWVDGRPVRGLALPLPPPLYRFCRSSGIIGLRGMAAVTPHACGTTVVRPLLSVPKVSRGGGGTPLPPLLRPLSAATARSAGLGLCLGSGPARRGALCWGACPCLPCTRYPWLPHTTCRVPVPPGRRAVVSRSRAAAGKAAGHLPTFWGVVGGGSHQRQHGV
jgi:hypothetical protein